MSDCIINPEKPLDKDGYPKVKFNNRTHSVARMLLTLMHGEKAMLGKMACHTCGNRACVNPNHIYIGTAQDNSDDKYRDGTMCFGENSGRWRHDISNDDIWSMYNERGMSQQEIGRMLGISQSAVSGRIRRMKNDKLKDDR